MTLTRIVLLAILLSPSLAVAQTPRLDIGAPSLQQIWVDPARGDDRANGRSAADAVRTMIEAWNRIPVNSSSSPLTSAGYEIRLMPGEYAEAAIPHYMERRFGSQ